MARWTFDRRDRFAELLSRVRAFDGYLARERCDATDPAARAHLEYRRQILARRLARLKTASGTESRARVWALKKAKTTP